MGGTAEIVESKADALGIIAAEFPAGVKPVLTVTSRVATKNYAVDLSTAGHPPKADRAELDYFLRPTKLLPTDGIVRATAMEITSGAKTDVEKARAIYEWIVDNTFRDPKTRGCGIGDIRFMLESRDLGGKCADLNALYVGLARAAGLPARDVYGIRVAKSELGYKSLGASSENVTKAQHCRAEVYLNDVRLGSGRSRRRAQGRARRTARKSSAGRRHGEEGARPAIRVVGDELDGVQLRPRCCSARIERRTGRLPDVSAGGNERRPARQPRSGQLQVRDHRKGNLVYQRLTIPDAEPAMRRWASGPA